MYVGVFRYQSHKQRYQIALIILVVYAPRYLGTTPLEHDCYPSIMLQLSFFDLNVTDYATPTSVAFCNQALPVYGPIINAIMTALILAVLAPLWPQPLPKARMADGRERSPIGTRRREKLAVAAKPAKAAPNARASLGHAGCRARSIARPWRRRWSGRAGGHGDDTAGAASAVGRGAGHQQLQVWRLEKAKTGAADGHAPDDVEIAWMGRQQCQGDHPEAQRRKARSSQEAGRVTIR